MKIIAHRGNIRGPNHDQENKPEYIARALREGYDVEVDVWFCGDDWYLGHDEPLYKIDSPYFIKDVRHMWFHCKNGEALFKMNALSYHDNSLNFFWHDTDDYALTSKGYVWVNSGIRPVYDLRKYNEKLIGVFLDYTITSINTKRLRRFTGICTDYAEKYDYALQAFNETNTV